MGEKIVGVGTKRRRGLEGREEGKVSERKGRVVFHREEGEVQKRRMWG